MKIIPLTRGYVALVDDEDFPTVSPFKWSTRIDKDWANGKKRRSASIFKGITFCRNRWRAQIKDGPRNLYLGESKIEVYAAYLYDLAAVRLFGDFAVTNFPVPGSTKYLFGSKEP